MATRQVELCKDVHKIRYVPSDLEVTEGEVVALRKRIAEIPTITECKQEMHTRHRCDGEMMVHLLLALLSSSSRSERKN